MPALKLFDLCAGIGGFSYALRPVATTVAYAEMAPANQAILKCLAARGVLAKAPIYDDVASLTTRVSGLPKPDIIAAGFPCQDLSLAGKRLGLHGPQSSLFFVVCDVIKAWSPDYVFFENVPAIKEYMPLITRRLKALGYQCTWDIFSAQAAGAPHVRKRWYCLCRKATAKPIPVPPAMTQDLNAWTKTPPAAERCIPGSCKACKARRFALGNSIVPQCARRAFLTLHARSFGLPPPALPDCAWNGVVRVVPPRISADNRLVLPPVTKPITFRVYNTPRALQWGVVKNLSGRSCRDLASQLAYQHDTPKMKAPYASPNFVEWMMGFPRDYTRLPCAVHDVKAARPSAATRQPPRQATRQPPRQATRQPPRQPPRQATATSGKTQ